MLRSLELVGFKSFADRTAFEFDPGVTCVVGPNGSGKSNVIDAIKWILGDQSAKSLRGSEMLDVVFNGSAARKPAPYAEATLTFDNSERPADSPLGGGRLFDRPDPRVSVGRRLYRSGESEYLINGEAVRLKDVRTLFLTGQAGTAAYSIIEQGRVDQILNANAAARRAVFEEAAGVSQFKAQRREAERKLDSVTQTLTRLTDFVDELETRLAATRSQAGKAAKYRDLTRELRTTWLGLAADETRWLRDRLAHASEGQQAATARKQQLDDALAAEAAQRETVAERLRQAERELAAAESERARSRERQAELRSTLRALRTQREGLVVETADRRRRWRSLAAERHILQQQHATATQQLEDVQRSRAAHDEAQASLDEALARTADELDAAAAAVVAIERQTVTLGEALATSRGQQQEIRSQRTAVQRRRDQIAGRVEQLQAEHAELTEQMAARRSELTAAESARGTVQDGLAEARHQRGELASQLATAERALAADTQERTAAVARQSVLRDLHQKGDGLGVGVRDLVERARSARDDAATAREPWASILGLAGELLECTVENAPLLDLALGARSQLVVTRNLAAVVAYLETSPPLSGRVGFIEVESDAAAGDSPHAPPQVPTESAELFAELETFYAARGPDLSHEPGVRSRADELAGGSPLAARLLGDTWIVDRLATARSLARRFRGVRLLTLSGELLEADGALHVGPAAAETAVLERRSELRQLASSISRLTRRLAEGQRRLEALQAEAATLDDQLADLERSQPDALRRAGQARNTVEGLQSQLGRLRDELAELAEESETLEAEDATLQQQADTLDDERSQARGEQKALGSRLDEARRGVEIVSRQREELQQQQQELSVRQAQLDERLASATATVRRLDRDAASRAEALAEAATALETTGRRASQTDLAWLAARSDRDHLAWEASHQESQVAAARTVQQHARADLDRLRVEEDRVRQEHQAVTGDLTQLQALARETQRELEQLTERMAEEFDLTLDEVVATADEEGLSPLAAARAAAAEDAPDETTGEAADESSVPFEALRDEVDSHVQRLRRKIKMLGSVNTDALADLDELETRYQTLAVQLQDLVEAKSQLEAIIARINDDSQRRFLETFEAIRGHFQLLFRRLFGGGQADLVLEEGDDPLECGLEIVARPPGKELRGLSLLSGGEKTLTAVGLLLAMFRAKPSPYCLLDEVDAALDEGNIGRFVDTVREFREETQFIVITHRRRTMVAADVLYGVTMETAGVSKRMSVKLEDVADDGAIRRAA